jgi:arylsulfatase A
MKTPVNPKYVLWALLFFNMWANDTALSQTGPAEKADPPNIVILFCDDLGYGDIGCFGSPTIKTPNLDLMASEGQKWTSFYVAAPICTSSRAGLLTGRYPIRNGMTSATHAVLFPNSGGGLDESELTIAELVKQKNYATAAIGKWHLGHLPQYLPRKQGFDSYFGVPYSNDMDATAEAREYHQRSRTEPNFQPPHTWWNVPLIENETVIERPADQRTLSKRYADRAIEFIKQEKQRPFLLYVAFSMPHIPLLASDDFKGKSKRGLYGDVVEEIDHHIGLILDTLRNEGLSQNTLVLFTSDNGPWLSFNAQGGSAGPLRAGKGTTFEGGQRVPAIFWMPGKIKPGSVVNEIGSSLDMMATISSLTDAQMPGDRVFDSCDLTDALFGNGPSPRENFFYWTRGELHAVRSGPWKMHVRQRKPVNYGQWYDLESPELFNVETDVGETQNVAKDHPDLIAKLTEMMKVHKESVTPVADQLAIPLPETSNENSEK